MRLSVIIIGYNSWHFLDRNLASLSFLFDDPKAEVIYIDNASTDGTLIRIGERYPGVVVIGNDANRGISVARNQGILRSSGEYIWLLDSDTEVNEATLSAMLAFMDSTPDVGLCGCKMYGCDGLVQDSCRVFPTVSGKLRAAVRIFARSTFSVKHYDTSVSEPFEVDYVIGACQLIRRSVQEEVGLLDERIFYGPEDADFCFRIREAGYSVYYLPQVSIYHAYQRLSARKLFSRITFEHLRGLVYYFFKHR
ncbi:MAG: glycosyltransferase family 2 protein [Dysgonamonadaceae bacterium]|jgi:GT2 family glycosyltransferase|nr:glycosyltransferase family 2 protein [Dysgonamonadaceae bacterium]